MEKREVKRIIDQLEKFYSDNWTGLKTQEMLNEIDDEMANAELPYFTNTIHQVVRHLLADDLLVVKRVKGINYQLTPEEDWIPPHYLKNVKWKDSVNTFLKSKKDVTEAFLSKCDNDLEKPVLQGYSSIYETFHGHIQHKYYHFGQISQMKKAIENIRKNKNV